MHATSTIDNMNRLLRLIIFCAIISLPTLSAQKAYFQQTVNYTIAVALDDQKHTLTGTIDMEYINNSPDALPEIWLHLWGNAFKNRRTAFAKQKLEAANGEFYFSDEKDLGYFKNLDFTVDGLKATWKVERDNPDIAKLTLAQSLAPGARIRIATPFLLKIPASFSRLGHVETSYQITQWFPKPAVYDNRGWHAMPYLDQGEFYSEFGSFDVTITLPENYVVGATGRLETATEKAFLVRKEAETREKLRKYNSTARIKIPAKQALALDTFPVSSSTMKTIRYTASRVHDFAWFADKRFNVTKDTARLVSGETVDCWAMFTNSDLNLWQKGASYVRRSTEFYSEHVGAYPYPHATAVHSALSAGGGMEYPMITVIGDAANAKSLDEVITHEVGHNWFYGILGSNERDHPFLDEGINSYYEQRYMRQYYGGGDLTDGKGLPKKLWNVAQQGSPVEVGCLMLSREHIATPPDSYSDDFTQLGYGLQVYMKTAKCLRWLEESLGTERFDQAMQAYYQQWQFKHPYPEDLAAAWKTTGLQADWFFETMQTERQADFVLTDIKRAANGDWELSVKNAGDLQAPFAITSLKDDKPTGTQWYEANTTTATFAATDADQFVIDYGHNTLDINRRNNQLRTTGVLPGFERLSFKPLSPIQNPTRNVISATTWIGWNCYDKTMLGLLIYNSPVPSRKLQYYLLPGIGLGSKRFTGLADVRYKLFPGGFLPKITVGVSAKTFDIDYNAGNDYYLKMFRIVPQVRFEFRDRSKTFRHFVNVRTLFIDREQAQFTGSEFAGKEHTQNTIYELRYEATQKRFPNPWKLTAALETQNYTNAFGRPADYVRSTLEWKQQFYYAEKYKITARFFAGAFLQSSERHRSTDETALALNPQGFNDYKYDQVFLYRGGGSEFLGRQVTQTDGGFKGAFGSQFAGEIGNSNNFIIALNLKADLPQRLPLGIPLKPYFDIGYFDDARLPLSADRSSSEQLLWSGGLMFEFFKGGLEFYFPLVSSPYLNARYCEQGGGKNTSAIFCGGNILKMVSWSVKVPFREPGEVVDTIFR